MTERTKFECDVTGELYGAKNAGDGVIEFDIVRRKNNPWDTWSETCHIGINVLEENELHGRFKLSKYTRLFVERIDREEKIVAAAYQSRRTDGSGTYEKFEERDSVIFAGWDERFFQFVEEELLY